MRKVIVIIRALSLQSVIARVVFFLVAFFLLISAAKSLPIAISSKLDSLFDKLVMKSYHKKYCINSFLYLKNNNV
jgi:hypothetical protein